MADVKLTPEWLEAEADKSAASATTCAGNGMPDCAEYYATEAEVFRLAARALRARERLAGRLDLYAVASDARTEIAVALAILDGRRP